MGLIGHISLSRGDRKSGKGVIQKCIENVEKGVSVFFFPEGTRTRTGKLSEFKAGAFKIAHSTAVPIVPISIEGTSALMPMGKSFWLGEDKGQILVTVHDWIVPSKQDSVESLKLDTFEVLNNHNEASLARRSEGV